MIKLDENFSIKTDANNFELYFEETFESKDKDGNPKTSLRTDSWYYPNMKQTLNRYLSESMRSCSSVKELIDRIGTAENTIKTLSFDS